MLYFISCVIMQLNICKHEIFELLKKKHEKNSDKPFWLNKKRVFVNKREQKNYLLI